ncbi:hypothetical protein [Marinobacter lutaoensis]|uniref:hypothetical protein n=1 Tax=Marinobacter lutaoensis TaxID=135739 RepID=UPI0011156B3D|nr:hypothetical protein [Marinobacter lutaoensis]
MPENQTISGDTEQFPTISECVKVTHYENGRTAGVKPFLFTWAIIADFTPSGYKERWCYHSLTDALAALNDWDGNGEPDGWHRHVNTGRRRDEHGNDIGVW